MKTSGQWKRLIIYLTVLIPLVARAGGEGPGNGGDVFTDGMTSFQPQVILNLKTRRELFQKQLFKCSDERYEAMIRKIGDIVIRRDDALGTVTTKAGKVAEVKDLLPIPMDEHFFKDKNGRPLQARNFSSQGIDFVIVKTAEWVKLRGMDGEKLNLIGHEDFCLNGFEHTGMEDFSRQLMIMGTTASLPAATPSPTTTSSGLTAYENLWAIYHSVNKLTPDSADSFINLKSQLSAISGNDLSDTQVWSGYCSVSNDSSSRETFLLVLVNDTSDGGVGGVVPFLYEAPPGNFGGPVAIPPKLIARAHETLKRGRATLKALSFTDEEYPGDPLKMGALVSRQNISDFTSQTFLHVWDYRGWKKRPEWVPPSFITGLFTQSNWSFYRACMFNRYYRKPLLEALYDAGQAMDPKLLPEHGSTKVKEFIDGAKNSEESLDSTKRFVWYRDVKSAQAFGSLVYNEALRDKPEQAVAHLSACAKTTAFPPATVTPATPGDEYSNELGGWTGYSTTRAILRLANGDVSVVPLARYGIRSAEVPGTKRRVIVFRYKDVTTDYTFDGGTYPANPPSDPDYLYADSISPVNPDPKITPDCNQLVSPLVWSNVTIPPPQPVQPAQSVRGYGGGISQTPDYRAGGYPFQLPSYVIHYGHIGPSSGPGRR